MAELDAQSIINYIGSAPKKTPVKVYLRGASLDKVTFPEGTDPFVSGQAGVVFGDWQVLKPFLAEHEADFESVRVENTARNSAVPLLDLKKLLHLLNKGFLGGKIVVLDVHKAILHFNYT